ncbi:hypothetical protein LOC68_07400 [Blastopirellula sp. JC732]|uniref:Uncharacterized protein n=1 Tax=Blastopirellula sediminis TaxID=2894196 RepID=A0A9X1MKH6_9BACT|nr:hypothetical protein [Blastopirellula sediminis]MCC9628216.1 hypothetical protein [Blastopirellula sediminis]
MAAAFRFLARGYRMVNVGRIAYVSMFLLLVSLGKGCACSLDRSANTKLVGNTLVVSAEGRDYTFPKYIDFDGQQWTRSDWRESRHFEGGVCVYLGQDANQRLTYHQDSQLKVGWSLQIERRTRPGEPFVPKGKKRLFDSESECMFDMTVGESGFFDGAARNYYSNGVVKLDCIYAPAAELQGPATGYYPTGSVWWTGEFQRDRFDYENAKFYDESGGEIKGLSLEEKEKLKRSWSDTTSSSWKDCRPQ